MQAYLAVSAIILSMVFVAAGSGLSSTFIPIHLTSQGVSTGQVGAVVTAFSIGMLLGCIFGGKLVRRVGHIRAFSAYSCLIIVVVILMYWQTSLTTWLSLRFLHGFCATSLFMISQSWLNEATLSKDRGRVVAFFYVSFTLAYGGGALILAQIDAMSIAPLTIACGLYAIAVIPISTTLTPSPALPKRISVDLRGGYRLSSVGMVGAFVSGMLGMTFQSVGPIYGSLLGLAPGIIATMMALTQVGNLIIQWPLGHFSDRTDRRLIIFIATVAVFIVSLILWSISVKHLAVIIILLAIFAGFSESLYSISTAHANDRAAPGDYVTLTSTLLVLWSSGATLGPIIATGTMSTFGSDGLPVYFATVAGLFGLFTLWRRTVRDKPLLDQQEEFVALPECPIFPVISKEPQSKRQEHTSNSSPQIDL